MTELRHRRAAASSANAVPRSDRTKHQAPPAQVRHVSSEWLLGGATELQIEHGTTAYRLCLTSLGKLILTK